MRKKTERWSDYLNIIAEKITSKGVVSPVEWQNLLVISDTFHKCKEGYWWAKGNLEMETSFYQKMIKLQETTFHHKKVLAILAKERGDEKTRKVCLDFMVQSALATERFAIPRCAIVLKLMSQDDRRRSKIEIHRNYARSLA